MGALATLLACLGVAGGCAGADPGAGEPGLGGEGGESHAAGGDGAGEPERAEGGGGTKTVDHAGTGGAARDDGGAAGSSNESGDAGASGVDEAPADLEACLADLVGPAEADVISVRGHAGVLGDVDYTIAGYSAGASATDGLQRFTNSTSGQRGSPAGIDDTGLWMWTEDGPVVLGKLYASGPNVAKSARIDFNAYAAQYTIGASCPAEAETSGHFILTEFDPTVGGFGDRGILATGGYDFQCPEAGIDVRGCFRYVK